MQELDSAGVEKALAVMFLDLRDFTQLSQSRLPYDVVFILNEFFAATGSAIHTHGGWIDKFLGDGLLAVFGQRHGVEAGCRQALRAARAIDLALDHVNAKLGVEIGKPLRVGMGIHAGPMLLGRIGYGEAVDLTVVGQRRQRGEPAGGGGQGEGPPDRHVVGRRHLRRLPGRRGPGADRQRARRRRADGGHRRHARPRSAGQHPRRSRAEGPKTTAQRLKREPAATP